MSDCGLYEQMLGKRDAVLAGCRLSRAARARILGKRYFPPVAKTHRIVVDLKNPEARTVETIVGDKLLAPKPAPKPAAELVLDLPPTLRRIIPDAGYTVREILEAVAESYKVTLYALLSPARSRIYAYPRFAAAKLLRDKRLMSYARIGFSLGRRDHSTAINEIHRATDLLETDPRWAANYHAAELALCRP